MEQIEGATGPIGVTSTVKKVQVAVIGCGSWGRNLVRCFTELGSLGAVVDHHSATVEAVAARYATQALSFDQVLAEPSIQAVAIATQPSNHYDLAKRAVLAGKHVFVEKPLTIEIKHAEELTDLSRRLGRRLMVGHILQYHPAFSKLQSLIASGVIGHVLARLETDLSAFCGAKHAISCGNGSDALALILMAKGVNAGDAVFCPSFTFAATAEAIAGPGATPDGLSISARRPSSKPYTVPRDFESR